MSESIKLSQVGNILSNIGNKLITNQNLLKCIHYCSQDALSQSNLSIDEIINLVGKGSDSTQQRIFKLPFNNTIIDGVRSELRFYLSRISPENIYISKLPITFQVIIHNSLWELDNNQLRPLIMIQEILSELNGNSQNIGGIGKLQLTKPINVVIYNDNYSGYMFELETRTV